MRVSLDNAESFIPIIRIDEAGNAVQYYGGDQAWYRTNVGRYSGCGAVAAADIFAYLSLHHPGMESLYQCKSTEITTEDFLEHMAAVIKYVPPGKLPFIDMPYSGLTSLPRFMRCGEAFAASRCVHLKGQYHTNRELSLEEAIRRIGEQLANDNPVALLNMQNSKLKCVRHADAHGKPAESDLRYHWVVITAIARQEGRIVITVSSEGSKIDVDFADVWNTDSKSLFGWRGIVYFI